MKNNDQNWLRVALTAAVILHLAVAIWHGSAHSHVPVPLSTVQTLFVVVVIILLPVVGAGVIWTRKRRPGAWIVAGSMLGSLLFGIINHFVVASPDNVASIPVHEWHNAFILSAEFLVATEAIGTILGAIAINAWRNRSR